MVNKIVVIKNKNGLQINPAAQLVSAIDRFESSVMLRCDGSEFNAKSILGLASAMIKYGETIEIITSGCDEGAAMNVIYDFLEKAE